MKIAIYTKVFTVSRVMPANLLPGQAYQQGLQLWLTELHAITGHIVRPDKFALVQASRGQP